MRSWVKRIATQCYFFTIFNIDRFIWINHTIRQNVIWPIRVVWPLVAQCGIAALEEPRPVRDHPHGLQFHLLWTGNVMKRLTVRLLYQVCLWICRKNTHFIFGEECVSANQMDVGIPVCSRVCIVNIILQILTRRRMNEAVELLKWFGGTSLLVVRVCVLWCIIWYITNEKFTNRSQINLDL